MCDSAIQAVVQFTKNVSLVLLAALAYATPTFAFDNEPDGFRGIHWGASASSIQGLVKNPDAASWLAAMSGKSGLNLSDLPLESYSMREDKYEFGRAKMSSISYYFYNDKFYFANLTFRDTTNYPSPDFGARSSVLGVLSEKFGKPTESQSLLKSFLLPGIARNEGRYTIYSGDKAIIDSRCFEVGGGNDSCGLIFRSVELDKEFDAEVSKRKTQRVEQSRIEAAQKEAIKAKPDF